MKKYEYHIVGIKNSDLDIITETLFNNLGLEGWELVGVTIDTGMGPDKKAYFKRILKEEEKDADKV